MKQTDIEEAIAAAVAERDALVITRPAPPPLKLVFTKDPAADVAALDCDTSTLTVSLLKYYELQSEAVRAHLLCHEVEHYLTFRRLTYRLDEAAPIDDEATATYMSGSTPDLHACKSKADICAEAKAELAALEAARAEQEAVAHDAVGRDMDSRNRLLDIVQLHACDPVPAHIQRPLAEMMLNRSCGEGWREQLATHLQQHAAPAGWSHVEAQPLTIEEVAEEVSHGWVQQNERTPEEIALRWLLDSGVRRTVDGEYHDDTGCKVYAPDEVEDTIQNMGYLGKQRHMWHRVRVKWADQFDIHATPDMAEKDAETQVLEQLRARVHNNDLIGYEFTITLID